MSFISQSAPEEPLSTSVCVCFHDGQTLTCSRAIKGVRNQVVNMNTCTTTNTNDAKHIVHCSDGVTLVKTNEVCFNPVKLEYDQQMLSPSYTLVALFDYQGPVSPR